MKNISILIAMIFLLGACSTTHYENFEYDNYFQGREPFIGVQDESDAARYIARKVARRFRRMDYRTMAVLNFTDQYGDPIRRGVYFADHLADLLSRRRNPVIIQRSALYDIIREREFFRRDLMHEGGYLLRDLVRADYVLTGRFIRGDRDEMISVRCFEAGSGRVVYAATVRVEHPYGIGSPDDLFIPRPRPGRPFPPRPGWSGDRPSREDDEDDADDGGKIKKLSKKNDGIENVGKKDKDKKKPSSSDKVRYKKKSGDDDGDTDDNNGGVLKKGKKTKKKNVRKEPAVNKEVPVKKESGESGTTVKEKKSVLKR